MITRACDFGRKILGRQMMPHNDFQNSKFHKTFKLNVSSTFLSFIEDKIQRSMADQKGYKNMMNNQSCQ